MLHRLVTVLGCFAAASCSGSPPPPLPAPVPVPAEAIRPPQAFASSLRPLEEALRARLAREAGEFAVVAIDLETGRSLGINDRLVLHAASTMKVPVLLELYRRAATGEIDLDGRVRVHNRFRSIADTSHYSLDPGDDSERELYGQVGGTATYRDLARRMTVRSSNLATNLLIEILGAPSVQATADRLGAAEMRVLRGVEDGAAFHAGMNNSTTARAFANLLAAVARCDVLPRRHCDEVLDILAAQQFNDMIPAGLPAGIRVAHKTGWISGIRHDGAIILPGNSPPFVLVVLTRDADSLAARAVAADVARLAWQALGPGGTLRPAWPPAALELLALHDRVRVPAFPAPRLPHAELWHALEPLVDASPLLHQEEVARSLDGRPIRLVRFGNGPVGVLLWSQMHGDETTASRALADLFNLIAAEAGTARVQRWGEQLTVLAVPMLNPDGADAHRRRGAHGIDINRDARALATPEARALMQVQERLRPQFGFNLHDQNPRSRVGTTQRVAAMSLLAPPPDEDGTRTPSFERATRLTAHIARAVAPLVGEHLTRYDDSYNARAFGDAMQARGVSTVLIETGSWHGDESKHYLRRANFVALVSALDAIAGGAWQDAEPDLYASLPANGRPMNDLLILGGTVVLAGHEAYRADIAIDAAAVGGPAGTQVVDVGDLIGTAARDSLDAAGLFIHIEADGDGRRDLQPGHYPRLRLRTGAGESSELVWTVDGVTARQLALPRR